MDLERLKSLLPKRGRKEGERPFCTAVIVAAGSSQRMGNDKIFAALGGLPVLVHSVRAFEENELVDEIIVVTREEKLEAVAALVKKYELGKVSKVILGGKTRVESCLAGVSEADHRAKLIAIHDGARPLVTQAVIRDTVRAADEYYAAVPVVRSTDTLKLLDEQGVVAGSVDRETIFRVQTPQVFRADLIKGALTEAMKRGLPITDDCSAMELMGVKTHTVEGDEDNIKLTTPRDMVVAEAILRENRGVLYASGTRV
ncbi:MAG: 2-C-methyl-D-erythritol 4-phosphate cytidylyltransferase [Eubacteriales bacterium]|nr:2-C-methyl-D-erythritol 4-phosphate cytidylyltransferase [Eubacteriales bacterium]